jgi:RimJ/RimL family protein N-acetyltransferase
MNTTSAKHVPEITTSRLLLRALSSNDTADILAIHSDAQTLIYWGHEAIAHPEEAAALIHKNIQSGFL